MKNTFFLLLMLSAVFMACDPDDLTETDITTDLTETFSVDVSSGSNLMFAKSGSASLTDADGLLDVALSSIEKVAINSITYTVVNYESGSKIKTGAFNISNSDQSAIITESITDFDLAASEGTATEFTYNADTAEKLITDLMAGEEVYLSGGGELDSAPAKFDVEITINVTATVDVID